MNIYLHEMKTYRLNTLIWTIAICGLTLSMMSFYPFIKSDIDMYMEFMENFPPAMKAIMGLVIENFTSPVGFYAFVFTYSTLIAAIQAMNLGVGIISKEERERTADFLMTKPVSRTKIMIAKLFAAITLFVITNLVYFAVVVALISKYSEGGPDMLKLFLMNGSLLLMQLIFFTIGIVVSGFMKKVRSVLPISLGMVFAFFAISAFAVTSNEDKLRFITPFQYYPTQQILDNTSYEWPFVILSAAIIIVGIGISYSRYIRKSIPAV